MMSDYVPEAADTLAAALPQPNTDDAAQELLPARLTMAAADHHKSSALTLAEKMDEDAAALHDRDDHDEDESKENVAPISSNVVVGEGETPSTPSKKRKHRSGRIGKRELLQVASPKPRWLPARTQEKRRNRSTNRFEFEEKEAQPLWEGEGRKLEDSELVVDNIKFFSRNDTFLKQVHQVFYNRACKANEVKANLIAFSGFPDYYQEKAQEKLEAKSVSFLKLLSDVLGVPHGDDGKKASLVSGLVDFLAHPKKVRRGVNLAEKADTLKEQRRVAKENKEKKETKKAKRTSTSGKDKKKDKKTKTKTTRKAKASDFYSDIESDDDDEEDMQELYKWDKAVQAKNEAEAKITLDRIAEREAAALKKKLEKKEKRKRASADDDDDDDEEDNEEEEVSEEEEESEDEEAKKKRKEAERRKKKEAEKRRKAKEEEKERKKRKIMKAKRKHEEEEERRSTRKQQKESEDEQESEEEEEKVKESKKSNKRRRIAQSDDDDDESANDSNKQEDEDEAIKAQETSRKRRKIVVDDEDEDDEPKVDEVKPSTAGEADSASMQLVEKEEDENKAGAESEEERREKTVKTQEAIRETLRQYLKEQLTLDEVRLQTPTLLRLHVESVLGHSVAEHTTFIRQCLRDLFAA